MPMPAVTFANHLAIEQIECRKQGGRAGAIAASKVVAGIELPEYRFNFLFEKA